ncbi:glycosyltransferase [Flavobacterium sp. UMI-01]|uniref:glycosyltransferase n=1 Tax=Flavobacterium sp. UMI-01 TaxID=1441053 RepID=UPI001C7D1D54|nr:glycosyltransferase [Flavobacterium sp. UMI-01]GIZ07479.1 glycosyl transferase [Flavobacterium sp. UMI-01]
MRILQIIDSLEAGGAERMAVNYANALVNEIAFSGLVATRKEGPLVRQLNQKVQYLFLERKKTLDFRAVFRLRKFVKKHKVTIVHAHGTSYFIAVLLKLIRPSIRLIWHDHYGNSEFLEDRSLLTLRLGRFFFGGVIVVNQKLKLWVQHKMGFKNVIYLPNFVIEKKEGLGETVLKGQSGKRIICLANLREQKNHFLLLKVAVKMKETYPEWTFHLVGKDFKDEYSRQIKQFIGDNELENTVFVYESLEDVESVLHQATIGVLCSKSEGLPVSLLEYGLCKIPVVVSNVGEIGSIIQNGDNGVLLDSLVHHSFYKALVQLIDNEHLRAKFGLGLQNTIKKKFTESAIIEQYLTWLKKTKR